MRPAPTLEDGIVAAEQILKVVHRVAVSKALDPLDPDDYLVIVDRLARAIKRAAGPVEARAVRAALRELDVDWSGIDAAQRTAAVAAARDAIGRAQGAFVAAVRRPLNDSGPRVFASTRIAVSADLPEGITISATLSARDRVAERLVRSSTANFVRDEFGRRRDDLADLARETVARGVEQGLGRDEIARSLRSALGNRIVRSEAYYRVVAGAFVNRARTFSQLLSFQEAGIDRYVFEAVLDEVTTDVCRFYHGQTFNVAAGISVMERTLASEDPEDIREISPWIRTGRDADGNKELFFIRGEERVRVARIERSAVGRRDDQGEFSRAMTPRQLERAGIPYPPLHGHCRSTIVADT